MVGESWAEDDGGEREGRVSSEAILTLTWLNVDLLLRSPAAVSSQT